MKALYAGIAAALPVLIAASGTDAAAQAAAPPCGTAGFSQFDFWVGEWTVTAGGKEAGTNRIEKVLDGCALLETWRSVGKHRGHSLTFYDAPRDLWHQTWVDVAGQPLYLDGRFENGRMQLEGTRPAAKAGDKPVLHRITWTPLQGERVRQHWVSSSDGGKTWQDVFDGYYARKR